MSRQEKFYHLLVTLKHGLIFHPEVSSFKLTRYLLLFSLLGFACGLISLANPQMTYSGSVSSDLLILLVLLLGLGWCIRELLDLICLYSQTSCPLCLSEPPTVGIPWLSRYRLMEYFTFYLGTSLASVILYAGPKATDTFFLMITPAMFLPALLLLIGRASGLTARIEQEIQTVLKPELEGEDLDGLSTYQLEQARELAAGIMQHHNLQLINRELNERKRQLPQ
ncbi:MAG: hypothetical protein SFV17_27015 [Candidatus Obscuribacter sp.]|nr:hypothetical protein [Candidatus Obscuribacter sp.]